ncbi:MAG: hypothetical protein PF961_21690 [Planctomycetota bacterium]|jgi:hypothetical protein|nr:hypothetical protein [Planctomycetota bacterium]
MSHRIALVFAILMTLGLGGCGSDGGSDGAPGDGTTVPRTFTIQDISGVWVLQGVTDAYGQAWTGGLNLEVDGAGAITKAVYHWNSNYGPVDFAVSSDFVLETTVSQAGAVSIVAYETDGETPAVSILGSFDQDGQLFSGSIEITAYAQGQTIQLLDSFDGTCRAARFDAAVAGRLPAASFTDFGVTDTYAASASSPFHNGTFTTVENLAEVDGTVDVTLTYTQITAEKNDLDGRLVGPDGLAINVMGGEFIGSNAVNRVLPESTRYFIGNGNLRTVAVGATFSLTLAQAPTPTPLVAD